MLKIIGFKVNFTICIVILHSWMNVRSNITRIKFKRFQQWAVLVFSALVFHWIFNSNLWTCDYSIDDIHSVIFHGRVMFFCSHIKYSHLIIICMHSTSKSSYFWSLWLANRPFNFKLIIGFSLWPTKNTTLLLTEPHRLHTT